MDRFVAESIGDLLAFDDDELVVGAVQRVQSVDVGEVVVIGDRDEVVAMLAIPPHDVVRVESPSLLRVCVWRLPLYQRPSGLPVHRSLAKVEGLELDAATINTAATHNPIRALAMSSLDHRLDARIIPHHRHVRTAFGEVAVHVAETDDLIDVGEKAALVTRPMSLP